MSKENEQMNNLVDKAENKIDIQKELLYEGKLLNVLLIILGVGVLFQIIFF